MVRHYHILPADLSAVYSTEFLSVFYRAEQDYLEARWSRLVSSGEFRQGIDFILGIIREKGIKLLLIDFRRTGVSSVSDQNWLAQRLVAANHDTPLRRSARLLSGDFLQGIVSEVITEKVAALPYESESFCSESLARQWLFREVEQ